MKSLYEKLRAYWHAFIPLSCLCSPRTDAISGLRKWQWLAARRRAGALIDPSVNVRCGVNLDGRLDIGGGAAIDRGSILWISDECGLDARIVIGERVYIGPYTFLGSCHFLKIGNDTLIGANSYIITANHRTDNQHAVISAQGYRGADVTIGSNVWLGAHVVVLPGVTIGDGAVVGAGAVVTKDIPARGRWAGVPAKPIDGDC
jgi:acetyltransferase-like isoleucine patch superfamily enzyme